MSVLPERWKALYLSLDPRLPPDMRLYVKPRYGCADSIARQVVETAQSVPKYLLVGGRGGGKSTELRKVSQALDDPMTVVSIPLDLIGANTQTISAFDLLYVSGLAVLKRLPDGKQRKSLFKALSTAYAPDKKERGQLGDVEAALSGLAEFASASGATATALGFASGGTGPAGIALGMAGKGVRLLSHPESAVVAEASPRGQTLLEACKQVALAVRKTTNKPLCLLIDGLENLNGNAGVRFDQIFTYTQLLAEAPWSAVMAAPPSTLTQTNSVDGRGFTTVPVWGFGPDDDGLVTALERRINNCDIDPVRDVDQGQLKRIAHLSGGLPRHAIYILKFAVWRAFETEAQRLGDEHVDYGLREVGTRLATGLTADHFRLLQDIHETHVLPRDELVGQLFADSRIVAYPPAASGLNALALQFDVVPLLQPTVASTSSRLPE